MLAHCWMPWVSLLGIVGPVLGVLGQWWMAWDHAQVFQGHLWCPEAITECPSTMPGCPGATM